MNSPENQPSAPEKSFQCHQTVLLQRLEAPVLSRPVGLSFGTSSPYTDLVYYCVMNQRKHLARLDAWLRRLRTTHPLLFNLLALAVAVLVFALMMLLIKEIR